MEEKLHRTLYIYCLLYTSYCALGWAFADGKGKPEENYNKRKKIFASCAGAAISVSYTHLDVYKRQDETFPGPH